MKKIILIGLSVLLLTGCFWDEPTNTRHLVKDFNLGWWAEPRYQSLFQNSDKNEYGGGVIISETVFAVGYDDNFILAKQHPNNDDTISWNNINEHETWKLDSVPSDTLGDQRSYVKINGEWYGISNGRNMHHDLFPDKKITYYYIIDIRNYDRRKWRSKEKVYKFETEMEFDEKRKELGVPDNLTFTLIDKDLE
ncbi:MAG: hypothetical protein KDB74_09570 [Flavobacteriales bacterium]|nr:hypothetical protein [Flavobacteriales bacterium]